MILDAVKNYLALASGLTDVTRQRAVSAAKALVSQGEATRDQVSALADDLVATSRSNREAIATIVRFEVDRAMARLGLAPADEVSSLTARVRVLEASVRELAATVGSAAAFDAGSGPGVPGSAEEAAAEPEGGHA